MTYSETITWLFEQFPAYHNLGKEAYNPGLKNIQELSAYFGNPHERLRFIHVGGTNGKGSVSNMSASILTESGERVGLFTSPHLFDFNERIRVNGLPIEEKFVIDFCVKIKANEWQIAPSFFEITWVMALCYFEEKKCSIVVAEVGLGGRLDATNIITPIASVITNIGLDHTSILGNTRAEIAYEKAGIIKRNIPLFLGEVDSETFPVFEDQAELNHAEIILKNKNAQIPDSMIGYQIGNYQLVSSIFDYLEKIGFNSSEEIRKQGLLNLHKNTGFWGRMEIVSHSPLTIVDCAHNAEGIDAFLSSISTLIRGKLHIIYGTSADKNLEEILSLFPREAAYYFTTFSNPRSIQLEDLKQKTNSFSQQSLFFKSPTIAYNTAQIAANKEDTILIFGSFFLVHDFFEVFFKKPLARNKI